MSSILLFSSFSEQHVGLVTVSFLDSRQIWLNPSMQIPSALGLYSIMHSSFQWKKWNFISWFWQVAKVVYMFVTVHFAASFFVKSRWDCSKWGHIENLLDGLWGENCEVECYWTFVSTKANISWCGCSISSIRDTFYTERCKFIS